MISFYLLRTKAMDWIRFQFFCYILTISFANTYSSELGSPCTKDKQCKIDNSYCSSGVCICKHYYAQMGVTECLESKLLEQDCLVNEQCLLRVANSTCRDGYCHCSQGFIQFRKHTCLGPAKPGDVCYSNEHCKLWNSKSHCKFLIPKLFGKCICGSEGNCESDKTTKPPMTDSPAAENNKTKSTEATTVTVEYNNKGEDSDQSSENISEKSEKPQKINSLFVDPFLHKKEPLPQVNMIKEKGNYFIRTSVATEGETRMEDDVIDKSEYSITEESSRISVNPEASLEGTKYRVEVSEKNMSVAGTVKNRGDVSPVSLGYPCRSDVECQKRDSQSQCMNGVCDCILKTNTTNSCGSDNTGCGPETFQCRESGICISWFFVCDGRNDCPDKSDEECQGPKCPKNSFQCGIKGPCVSLAVICDGVKNCPRGEDEHFCFPEERNFTEDCPSHTFQCDNKQCLPMFEFCNAIPKCSDGSDESPYLCSSMALNRKAVSKKEKKKNCPFECKNGRCRSTAIICSGRDGCGDNSDEANCSVCNGIQQYFKSFVLVSGTAITALLVLSGCPEAPKGQ